MEKQDAIIELQRRLTRLNERRVITEQEHLGNEDKYTYHGGFALGHIKGKITEIENAIDILNDLD